MLDNPPRRPLQFRLGRLGRRGPAGGIQAPAPAPGAMRTGERIAVASQRQLIWWRFKRHKMAVASAVLLIGMYSVALFADFLATADPQATSQARILMPPQAVSV